MNGNIYDYLIPVGDAGDKSFSNGKQDVISTKEQERKAEDIIKQIALKKQLELERGNTEKILEAIKSDTPDGAVYRAMLLQQLEKESKKKTEEAKEKDEDNRPGVIKRVASWVGDKALTTAKLLGWLGLRYMAAQTVMYLPDIINGGPSYAWHKWLAEKGVAKSPGLAEQSGDPMAAVDGSILRRNVKIKDLNDEQKEAVLQFAEDKLGKDVVNTRNANFSLKNVFKKGDDYFDKLPDKANPAEYERGYAMMFDTGGRDGNIIPVSTKTMDPELYNSLFKAGNVRTEITENDN